MQIRLLGYGVALVVLGALLAFFVPFFFHDTTPLVTENETINSPAGFVFEIARTEEARQQGLSGRADVPTNYGMLFVFDTAGIYGFWMHDMLVPIDIVWLDTNGVIVGIEHEVSPDTFPDSFYPPTPVRYVLEVAAGESYRQAWEVGTRISLPL